MLEDPICCAPRVDTFLAVTKIKPAAARRPERTEAERREIRKQLIDCLDSLEEIELDL